MCARGMLASKRLPRDGARLHCEHGEDGVQHGRPRERAGHDERGLGGEHPPYLLAGDATAASGCDTSRRRSGHSRPSTLANTSETPMQARTAAKDVNEEPKPRPRARVALRLRGKAQYLDALVAGELGLKGLRRLGLRRRRVHEDVVEEVAALGLVLVFLG